MNRTLHASLFVLICAMPVAAHGSHPPAKGLGRLYIQVAGGPGYHQTFARYDDPERGRTKTHIWGGALSSDLQVGVALNSTLTVGGAFSFNWVPAPLITQDVAGSRVFGTRQDNGYVFFGGPFLDAHLDPDKGLHVQAVAGWGGAEFFDADATRTRHGPRGVFFGAGVGYRWRLDDRWSLGFLARLVYAPLPVDGLTYKTFCPAGLLTVSRIGDTRGTASEPSALSTASTN